MSQTGRVVSVHCGAEDTFEKVAREHIEMDIGGIVGDRHHGTTRVCWDAHDKQPGGTVRRNERQWSAMAAEDLVAITEAMQLSRPLEAAEVGINLCLEGIADLSRLPRGTLLQFASGAVLMVEEYNPPCAEMGAEIARLHTRRDGGAVDPAAFANAAKFSRGVVGVVDVGGGIGVGDTVTANTEVLPKWLRR